MGGRMRVRWEGDEDKVRGMRVRWEGMRVR